MDLRRGGNNRSFYTNRNEATYQQQSLFSTQPFSTDIRTFNGVRSYANHPPTLTRSSSVNDPSFNCIFCIFPSYSDLYEPPIQRRFSQGEPSRLLTRTVSFPLYLEIRVHTLRMRLPSN